MDVKRGNLKTITLQCRIQSLSLVRTSREFGFHYKRACVHQLIKGRNISWNFGVFFLVEMQKLLKWVDTIAFFFFTLKTKKKSSGFQTKLDTFGQPLKTYDRFLRWSTLLATQTWTKRGTTTATTTVGKQWWVSWYRLKKYCCFTKTLRKGSLGYTWFNTINHGITSRS